MIELDTLDDAALIERAQGSGPGDLRAFDVLVHRHKGHVLANCRYLTGSAEEAEDLAQEVFVKVYFSLGTFEGRAKFRTWLDRIKANHCIDHVRSRRPVRFIDVDAPEHQHLEALRVEPVAAGAGEEPAGQGRVRQVLAAIPETLRIPLVLRDMDEMSYQDIAERMEIGLSAVKMRIKRGRETFRRLYDTGGSVPVQEEE